MHGMQTHARTFFLSNFVSVENKEPSSHRIASTRRDQHTLVPAAQSPEAGWEHLPRITRKSRSSISATGLGLFWRLEYQPELCRMPRNGKLKVAELRFVPNPASL